MSAVLKPSTSLRNRVSKEEWDARVDLAAAYQLAAHYKWTDLIFTHFSARVPGPEHHLLINPFGLMFDEITASTLVKIDQEGNILEDPTGLGINQAGFVIHGCIHEARPEANAVLHTHTRAGVAVSAMKKGLLPLSQHSLRVYSELTYHDYEGVALEMDERTRMARDLGKESHAMVLKNHGLLTLGKSVSEAFEYMYYLECACQIQVDALSGGQDTVTFITDETVEKGKQQFNRPNRQSAEKHWPALLRMLDRRGSDYKN
jgi:ribulose-5-phosphate 4-epimerase/fuculose-1-phosphate aldolase